MTKPKLLSIGAEAVLTKKKNTVIKERVKKSYRIPEIDTTLRSSRTRRETKVLEKLQDTGFVPVVIYSDAEQVIELSYIPGKKLAVCLEKQHYQVIGREIGQKIKKIHERGIIHGDLTTSNMILAKKGVMFIDFGLSFFSQKTEDKAVDLHVLEEALESKHYTVSKQTFAAVLEGYNDKEVLQRLHDVQKRGRNKKSY